MDYPSITDWRSVLIYYAKNFYVYWRVNVLWSIKSQYRWNLKPLAQLINAKNKTSALVLANGPSVGQPKPEDLVGFCRDNKLEVFGLNYMISSDLSKELNIDHFVSTDPNFLNPNSPEYDSLIKSFGSSGVQNVYLPLGYNKKVVNDIEQLGINIVHFCDIQGSQVFSQSISPLKPRSYVSMTAFKALSLAVFMGYKKIYILGFDNSFFKNVVCDQNNKLHRVQEHFDSKAYKLDGQKTLIFGGKRKMYQELIGNSRLFSDLNKFKGKGSEIVNIDPYSLTDAFPKIDPFNLRNKVH